MSEKQDYFKVGSRDNIVINHSRLSLIDPKEGGSPQKFLASFDEVDEVEKSYYRKGHLIHQWAEDRDSFEVADCPKPSEVMGVIADKVIQEIEYNGVDFTRELASDISIAMNYQRNWKLDTRLKNIYDGIQEYVNDYINRNSNKTYLTVNETEVVKRSTEAVENHPVAKELLFMQDTDFSNKKVYSELEIYWSKTFLLEGKFGVENLIELFFKAKLDKLIIDFDNKTITYIDPKTTSGGAYGFAKSFEAYKYYRQQAFYKWAVREFCKQNNIDIIGFKFINYNIAIDTGGLFQVVVYEITEDWITRGTKEYQTLVKRLVEHTATNQWDYSLEEMSNGKILTIPYKEAI